MPPCSSVPVLARPCPSVFPLREEPGVEQIRQIALAADLREQRQAEDLLDGLDDRAVIVADDAGVAGLDPRADRQEGDLTGRAPLSQTMKMTPLCRLTQLIRRGSSA